MGIVFICTLLPGKNQGVFQPDVLAGLCQGSKGERHVFSFKRSLSGHHQLLSSLMGGSLHLSDFLAPEVLDKSPLVSLICLGHC